MGLAVGTGSCVVGLDVVGLGVSGSEIVLVGGAASAGLDVVCICVVGQTKQNSPSFSID